mgnify:FL=1
MKTRNIWIAFFCLIGACLMQGCSVEDDDMVDEISQRFGNLDAVSINAQSVQALVTTMTAADGTFYLRESENRLLRPVNMKDSPYGNKEVRAVVIYKEVVQSSSQNPKMVDVYVTWIEEIYTMSAKDIADRVAGQYDYDADWEPALTVRSIDIVNDWVNSLTDGYLTLHYHVDGYDLNDIYLLTGQNPDDPYEMTLYGIPVVSNSNTIMPSDGLIAYKLDNLPPTGGEVKIVTLRWYSPTGWKKAQFYYRTE